MVTVGVTGATGFVGGALMAYLRGRGHRVIGVDDRSGPVQVEWPDLPVTRGDIRSTATLALLDTADVVLHLAAVSGVMACAQHPVESAAVNVEATDDLAHHLSGRKIPLAFASSFAVVGIPDALPITERTPAKPPHEYARQKAAGEAAVARWARESGVNAAVLRMSNIYGRYEVGGKVVAKGNVLNRFAEQAAAGQLSVNAPGTQRRDYIHLEDVLAHWEAAARWLATNPRSKAASVFDVASGESATVLDLAQRVVAGWRRLHPDRPVPRVEIVENPRGAIEILHPEFEVSRAETERVLRVRCAHSLDESLDSILRGENMLTGLSDRRPG